MMTLRVLGLFAVLTFVSCGQGSNGENYSNIKSIPDIVLTTGNHPHGFQQTQCFYCHVKQNIHQVDRIGSGELPTAIALTDSLGISACKACHGANGN